MAGILDTAGLLRLLVRGETVVLPSQRAAQSLMPAFNGAQRAAGRRAWEPPPLHPWTAWVEAFWSRLVLEGDEDRMLLNGLQERMLWAEIVAASPSGATLTGGAVRELARLAASATALCAGYGAGEQLQRTADSHDSRAFAEWHATFAARCKEEKLLSRSTLESAVANHLRAGHTRPRQDLHFVGFEQKTPAQTRLLAELERGGVALFEHHLKRAGPPAAPLQLVARPDPWEEARWAIRWAGECLRDEKRGIRTVALVVPDPPGERSELEPLLRELLAPELERVGVDLSSVPWQCSVGSALAKVTPLRDAVLLLRWLEQDLPLEQVSALLLSPFFSHRSAPEERVRFDTETLRRSRSLRPEMTLDGLLRVSRQSASRGRHPLALDGFEAVHKITADALSSRGLGSYADWAELVRKLLRAAGWPGERTLSAAEFQAIEAWDGLLDLLSTLDFSRRRISFRDFLGAVEVEAEDLDVGSQPSAPVTLLRLAETEGCSFDATVILRATDTHLPPPEPLHPLLGRGLQRSFEMPGADTASTYRRVLEQLQSLGGRSGQMLLTWSEADENGPLRPSPLAFDLRATPTAADELLVPAEAEVPVALQMVDTLTTHLPLTTRSVAGGAKVLELQAACGFRAFASLRLQANAPETRTLGMDARARGSVLHRALELFWAEVKTRAALRSLSPGERSELLKRCVGQAFGSQRSSVDPEDAWSLSFLAISEERLVRLLEHWLHFELNRGDFTVLPPEQEGRVMVGPLELTVRPDRIDKVEGGFVFVDYKTSFDLRTSHWLGDRPDAPQLPLYTLLREAGQVRGLAFAQLRPGERMGWVALQKEQGDIHADPKTKLHDFEQQTAAWRLELSRLAQAFADGATDVDPKNFPHTCRFCEQRPLCRVGRAATPAQDEDADKVADREQHG